MEAEALSISVQDGLDSSTKAIGLEFKQYQPRKIWKVIITIRKGKEAEYLVGIIGFRTWKKPTKKRK
jgi:hypothetical protein